jgi:hypothetical protein
LVTFYANLTEGLRQTDGFNYTIYSDIDRTFNLARGHCVGVQKNLPLLMNSDITVARVHNFITSCPSNICRLPPKVFVDIHPFGNYSARTFITGNGEKSLLIVDILRPIDL